MKILIDHYTFNAASKQITFTDYTSIRLDSILLITNVTDNIIIYNFALSSLGGTVATNVLTLNYNVTGMSNTDKLLIYYDDPNINAATDELLEILRDQMANDETLRKQLLQLLKPLSMIGSTNVGFGGRIQVEPLQQTATSLNAQVTVAAAQTLATVTTVGTVTNQTNMGGLNALDLQFNMAHTAWNTGIRSNITF